MPIIDVSLGRGRDPEMLRTLITELTRATSRALEIPESATRVIIREVPWTHWAAGDETMAEVRRERGLTDPGEVASAPPEQPPSA